MLITALFIEGLETTVLLEGERLDSREPLLLDLRLLMMGMGLLLERSSFTRRVKVLDLLRELLTGTRVVVELGLGLGVVEDVGLGDDLCLLVFFLLLLFCTRFHQGVLELSVVVLVATEVLAVVVTKVVDLVVVVVRDVGRRVVFVVVEVCCTSFLEDAFLGLGVERRTVGTME